MSEFNDNNNNNHNKEYTQDDKEKNNSSISDHFKQAFQKISAVYYNQNRVKSVKIQFINNNIQSFELPKDIGTDKLPDFGTFSIIDPEDNKEIEKPNVGVIEISEIGDKLGNTRAIQIKFATEAFFIEDMKMSREFRIPYHAIANIDIEHIIEYPGDI
ncbi:MAG TPA: hypothetical protein VE076_13010 [Nitrososphaeraceae archaeon]|nr:hypothetical protein [Nitrososphaeraceae archaeon]